MHCVQMVYLTQVMIMLPLPLYFYTQDMKADVMELGAHMITVQELKKSMETCQEKETNFQAELDDLETKIEGIDAKVLYSFDSFVC